MYFWRIKSLKAQLAVAPLTDRDVLPYVMANGAACALAFAMPPENPSGWDTALGFMTLPVGFLGTLWVYRQNGGRAGTDLLQRYTAIGWVVSVRLMPVILLGSLALYVVTGAPLEAELETAWSDALFGLGVLVVYFERLGHHVRQVVDSLPAKGAKGSQG